MLKNENSVDCMFRIIIKRNAITCDVMMKNATHAVICPGHGRNNYRGNSKSFLLLTYC